MKRESEDEEIITQWDEILSEKEFFIFSYTGLGVEIQIVLAADFLVFLDSLFCPWNKNKNMLWI